MTSSHYTILSLYAAACDNYSCSGYGHCFGSVPNGDPKCICQEGHFGPICQYNGPDPCDTDEVQQCHGNGVCSVVETTLGVPSPKCDCIDGHDQFTFCESLLNEVDSCGFNPMNPCQNGGNCSTSIANELNYTCSCPASKDKQHTCNDRVRHYCSSSPPTHLPPLLSLPSSHSSSSPSSSPFSTHSFLLTSADVTGQNCEVFFNPCEGQCLNGGTCDVIEDGHYFHCSCAPGYTGYSCETTIMITTDSPDAPTLPPELVIDSFCFNNGSLETDSSSMSTCRCVAGFTGLRCELPDVCGISRPCSSNARTQRCINTRNTSEGFVCACTEGWGGSRCDDDLDECLRQPSICHAGTCTNVPGDYKCACPLGWTGRQCSVVSNISCHDVGGAGLCGEGGDCVEARQDGGVRCKCHPGYDGELCQTLGKTTLYQMCVVCVCVSRYVFLTLSCFVPNSLLTCSSALTWLCKLPWLS